MITLDTDEKKPTQALQLGFELALKERDAVLRENAKALEERDQAMRRAKQLQNERDKALESLETLTSKRNTYVVFFSHNIFFSTIKVLSHNNKKLVSFCSLFSKS